MQEKKCISDGQASMDDDRDRYQVKKSKEKDWNIEKEGIKNGVSELGCDGIRRRNSISDRLVYLRTIGCSNTSHHCNGSTGDHEILVKYQLAMAISGSLALNPRGKTLGILITGHNLKDLERLLEKSKNGWVKAFFQWEKRLIVL
jgi:hypothetical protein